MIESQRRANDAVQFARSNLAGSARWSGRRAVVTVGIKMSPLRVMA